MLRKQDPRMGGPPSGGVYTGFLSPDTLCVYKVQKFGKVQECSGQLLGSCPAATSSCRASTPYLPEGFFGGGGGKGVIGADGTSRISGGGEAELSQ